jgi:phage terminase small subunit
MDAHCEKINANYEEMRADMNAYYENMDAYYDRGEARIDAYYDREEARMDAYYEGMITIIKECLGRMEAKKGSAPEEPESPAEPKEVPERATEQETGQAAEDRTGEQRLAVRHHRQRKKRAQENGGPRQKFAAFRGRVTRHAVPVLLKGHVRKGPGKKCHSGLRGQTKASHNGKRGRIIGRDQQPAMEYRSPQKQNTKDIVVRDTPEGRVCEKRRQTQPRCNSRMKEWVMKQRPHLGTGKTFIEALGQFRTGSSGADSRIFDYITESEQLATVEVSAPAEAEEVVP